MPPSTTTRRPQPPAVVDQTRRSSGRQVRSSISRPTNYYARPFGSMASLAAEDSQDETPPGFFPAIQYFTDAVAVLPKEVMRHFTLIKEVEAKTYGPTQEMVRIADRIDKLPLPPRKSYEPSRQALLSFTANNSTAGGSANVSMINGSVPGAAGSEATENATQVSPHDEQLEYQRREEFYNLRLAIGQVLANLDEKNGCLAEANRTLDRQLNKLDSVMPRVEAELSEEARLGSLTHWAYADNRKKNQGPERSRRDFAATSNLAAAAAAVHEGEIAAARNEGRSHTKKSRLHQQHMDSELDDRIPAKKSHHKGRKVAEVLDTKYGSSLNAASAQASKKRKTEKPGSMPMERSSSTMAKSAKGPVPTPRSTPAAELIKKKAKAPVPAPSKRRNPTASSPAQSPRMAASPTMANFAMANEMSNQRPSSRMRQTSSTLQYSMLADRGSPPREVQKRSNGDGRVNGDGPSGHSSNRGADDISMLDANDTAAPTDTKKESAYDQGREQDGQVMAQDTSAIASDADSISRSQTRGHRSRDRSANMRRSAAARNGEGNHSRSSSNNHILKQIASFNRSPVSGRRDTEDDSSASESRSASRSNKRPGRSAHRQGSRTRTPEMEEDVPAPPSLEADGEGDAEEEQDEHDDPDDPDEPKYCYCGRGSYGTMIGCENENCEREWFHLECTGLRAVPSENVKWYCDDCDPRNRRKSKSGRH